MTKSREARLRRLEGRSANDPYAHLTDEELQRRSADLIVQIVGSMGLDEMRAALVEPPFTPALTQIVLEQIARLQAEGRVPPG